ncbi:MAG: Asp-tRNA(Asn)/Glu-tRNA(Gln) amidotransferase GatCAB subunit B, partial [Saprospiraceae bacterium]|nr:Asp-tRNA(Asn)/Glu-tRNA(Gln) amidotransferase GatCAB subunit B [Saprospiraceae bacterium]
YQKLLPALLAAPDQAPLALAQQLNLIQSADEDFLTQLVAEVIAAFPDKVATYRKGKKGLLGFFMGEVMKRSRGKAEPKSTNALLRKMLDS